MERLPLIYLLAYSIPESIVLISLSAAIYGYDVLKNFRRILFLSVFLALTTYIVRYLPIKFGMNALIELPVFVFLTGYFLKVSLRNALIIILTGFVCVALAETLVQAITTNIFKLQLNNIFNILWQRLIYSWAVLLVLAMPLVLIIKGKISLISAVKHIKMNSLDAKLSILTVVLLLQSFFAGVLLLIYIYGNTSVWPSTFDVSTLMKIISFALIAIPIISFVLLKRLFQLSQQEAIIATQEAFIDNVQNLFVTLRGQRHDFLNHVQVLYSLMKLGRQKEGFEYIEHLMGEIQKVNDVVKVKNPCLSAVLNTKLALAETQNIRFVTNVETVIEKTNIKSLDLVKILGNLIDNAIEAVSDQPDEYKIVKVTIKKISNMYVFEVYNQRPVLTPQVIEQIFSPGFSTKGDSNHSGLGLTIVKEITKKYKGEIGIKSNETEGTIFTVIIPD